ncbi:histone H2A.v1-like isoform X2 [Melitaea cinxia]|uniref:histone H2A.v1-like isoform X2 n=2 Tax=Melitaea cinxia TaxID=113334 RepID=UPI001E27062A|nr:histone H2A.v1-like isoform X2 [Melitaea cinxia]XP_045451350.1 histone H2A.v1-like isoform X2 [Melitaea cinxia]XP_045451351.1 histone H2A.v1-like isoform X2 [Melitaea cinxia]XP_045451353.1 histone H2A.v1-like isoform X2 [Melitaea cinxia]XP_045451354.1 histone H2A.v1-like isoform X2 [Melitaea cinxia]
MGRKNKNESKSGNKDTDKPKEQVIQNKIKKEKLKKDKVPNNEPKNSKKIIFDDDGAPSSPANVDNKTQFKNSTNQKDNETSRKKDNSNNTNKKIIFGDDDNDPQDRVHKTVANSSKKKNQSNEEEPKDEDIDKFCDEIDEEDNKQFNIWVELLEAKLSSNKKNK